MELSVVRDLLEKHDLFWRWLYEDAATGAIKAVFAMELEELKEGLSEAGIVVRTFELSPSGQWIATIDSIQPPTLAQAFATLVKSTADFHERAETRKHSNLHGARVVMDEEYAEVWAELNGVIVFRRNPGDLTKELADLLVTMLGVVLHAGITEADLAAAMLEVAAKNDAKNDSNCVWHNGKYTRREKLEGGA